MKSFRSFVLPLLFCLLVIFCLGSCGNTLSQVKSSVNVKLPANLFETLRSRAAEDPT